MLCIHRQEIAATWGGLVSVRQVAVRDRPFERTVTMHKDSAGTVGFQYREGKIMALVKDSSAARNGTARLWSSQKDAHYPPSADFYPADTNAVLVLM